MSIGQIEIPVLRRKINAVPRRSASETWRAVSEFLLNIFGSHELAQQLTLVLGELEKQAQILLTLQELTQVVIDGGNILSVAIDIGYGFSETEDDLSQPICSLAEVGNFDQFDVTIIVRDQVQEIRGVIDLMGYRAPEGISVHLRNDVPTAV